MMTWLDSGTLYDPHIIHLMKGCSGYGDDVTAQCGYECCVIVVVFIAFAIVVVVLLLLLWGW